MEFILIGVILIFVMTYRSSSGEGVYKFVKQQKSGRSGRSFRFLYGYVNVLSKMWSYRLLHHFNHHGAGFFYGVQSLGKDGDIILVHSIRL